MTQSSALQRRLTAILAADVVGYSRLVGLDEAGTHRRLKALRTEVLERLVSEHHGVVINYAGDGVLVEFPSAVGAAECAVEIQRSIAEREPELSPDRRLALRIGLHVGDVIVDGASIYGDAVNIAARLEQIAEPGGICLSDRLRDEIASKVDITCEYGGEPPLKNIARRVGIWFWPTSERNGRVPRLLPPADKPSIAVLPFEDFGGGEPDHALSDGVAEDLTTALARLRWIFVVARTSTLTLKGQQVDVREAGRRLGVRYLLEGSVRCAGERVRINVQMIDGSTGEHIWANHFDGRLQNLLDLQDEIVASTVAAIEPNLLQAEVERIRLARPEDMRAHHQYLRAAALIPRAISDPASGALEEARSLLAQALDLDATYAPALALAAYTEVKAVAFGRVSDAAAGDEQALRLAERAIRADPHDPLALGIYGFVLANTTGEMDAAADLVDRALALNPNSALLWNFSGEVQMYLGDHDRAIEDFHRSIRLNPLDQRTITNAAYLGFAHLFRREPEEAARWAARAVVLAPNPLSYRILAASLAEAGRIDEARAAAAEMLRLQPNACLRRSRGSSYRRPEDLAAYVDALRKAGLPEDPTGELAAP